MIDYNIFLYWKPGPDLGIEGKENFDPDILVEWGKYLKEHLTKTAQTLTILRKNNWDYQGGLYDIVCYKDIKKPEAITELEKLGFNIPSRELVEFDQDY